MSTPGRTVFTTSRRFFVSGKSFAKHKCLNFFSLKMKSKSSPVRESPRTTLRDKAVHVNHVDPATRFFEGHSFTLHVSNAHFSDSRSRLKCLNFITCSFHVYLTEIPTFKGSEHCSRCPFALNNIISSLRNPISSWPREEVFQCC